MEPILGCFTCRNVHLMQTGREPCKSCIANSKHAPRDNYVDGAPKQEPKEWKNISGTACKAIIVDDFGAPSLPAPSHYSRFKIQPLDFIAANQLDFLTGNIIKYVMRHDAKNGLEDLQKAQVYLERLIQQAKGKETNA